MEPDIADILKDAFSGFETEFENAQFDEDTNAAQTHPTVDADIDFKDANELCSISKQNSSVTLANIYKPEKYEEPDRDGSADSNEETGSAICPSEELNSNDQAAEKEASEEPQENQLLLKPAKRLVDEQDINRDEVSMHELVGDYRIVQEEHDPCEEVTITYSLGSVDKQGMQSEEHKQTFSPLVLTANQTPEETSGSDEEGPRNYNTEEQTLQCDSDDNMDKSLATMNTPIGSNNGDDLKEFTEDDQEGVKESLAEYPSDLFQSDGEEHAKSARNQTSALTHNSFDINSSRNEMKIVPCVEQDNILEDVKPIDFTTVDSDAEVQGLEDQLITIGTSFQEEKVDEDDLQELLTNYGSTEEAGASNHKNQPDCDSDISNDHSMAQEEISFSVKDEEEWKSDFQHFNFIQDLGRAEDDTDHLGSKDRDGTYPEEDKNFPNTSPVLYREYSYEEPEEQSTDLRSTLESAQSDPSIKEDDQSLSELLNTVTNISTFTPEELWSFHVSMNDDRLPIDNYDWSFTEEEPGGMNLDEEENQEGMEDLEVEEKERDWEQEKTRIEAFYRYYDDQVDTEASSERNHKVTFCLDQEFSENEEDSDSSDQELEEFPDTLVNPVKQNEYHSESDDELQEKPFHPEKAKVRPKELQPVSPAQITHPPRRKCLAVMKSVLALGLMTVIGIASFWWATDNLD